MCRPESDPASLRGDLLGSCPLCGSPVSCTEYRDFVDVSCGACGDFLITRIALDELGSDPKVKAALTRQSRWITHGGGKAFIGTDTLEKARRRVVEGANGTG